MLRRQVSTRTQTLGPAGHCSISSQKGIPTLRHSSLKTPFASRYTPARDTSPNEEIMLSRACRWIVHTREHKLRTPFW
eukprot:45559-Eustigmatos_ZCMA.PRE.1